jgi:hypothetical protein
MISFFKKLQSNRAADEQLKRQQLAQDIKQERDYCNKVWIEDGKKYSYEPALFDTDDESISEEVDFRIEYYGLNLFLECAKCIEVENQERRRLSIANELPSLYSLKNEYEIQQRVIK